MPDILSFAKECIFCEIGPKDFDNLVVVAKSIKAICDERNLKIIMLQPFSNFEG